MGMVVRSNIMAYNANRQLGMNNSAVSKSLEKLASGFRINRAGDDASGLAISEKMKAQIKGLETASANAQDGISLVQTAEGNLTEVHDMLNRMVELATKSANGTLQNEVDRDALQAEVNDLKSEINRIRDSANFNGIKLLNGTMGEVASTFTAGGTGATSATVIGGNFKNAAEDVTFTLETTGSTQDSAALTATGGADTNAPTGVTFELVSKSGTDTAGSLTFKAVLDDSVSVANKEIYEGLTVTIKHGTLTAADDTTVEVAAGTVGGGLQLQIGDTADAHNKVSVKVDDMSSKGLGIDDISVADADSAASAIDTIKAAINTVSTNRANLGALQNRLEHTINNLDVTAENMSSANSRIRDTDMAKEMMNYTKMNVLTQAAQAMLAQANQQPQSILQLLQ